jgi:hypothetical protein
VIKKGILFGFLSFSLSGVSLDLKSRQYLDHTNLIGTHTLAHALKERTPSLQSIRYDTLTSVNSLCHCDKNDSPVSLIHNTVVNKEITLLASAYRETLKCNRANKD